MELRGCVEIVCVLGLLPCLLNRSLENTCLMWRRDMRKPQSREGEEGGHAAGQAQPAPRSPARGCSPHPTGGLPGARCSHTQVPGSLLDMQSLRPRPRPTALESSPGDWRAHRSGEKLCEDMCSCRKGLVAVMKSLCCYSFLVSQSQTRPSVLCSALPGPGRHQLHFCFAGRGLCGSASPPPCPRPPAPAGVCVQPLQPLPSLEMAAPAEQCSSSEGCLPAAGALLWLSCSQCPRGFLQPRGGSGSLQLLPPVTPQRSLLPFRFPRLQPDTW